jgi:hypothetical protein
MFQCPDRLARSETHDERRTFVRPHGGQAHSDDPFSPKSGDGPAAGFGSPTKPAFAKGDGGAIAQHLDLTARAGKMRKKT